MLEKFGLPVLLVVLILYFSFSLPGTFNTPANWRAIAISQAALAVAAMALMFPLVAGRFDISVGANVGVCSIMTAACMSRYDLDLVWAILVSIAVGSLIGLINGVIIAYLGVNSIITTLGVSIVLGGFVQAYTGGVPISENLSPTLTDLSRTAFAQVPVLFLIMAGIAVAVNVFFRHTAFGRTLEATGANEVAARLNGMPVRRVVASSFVLAGLLAGVAGVLQVASQGNGNPSVGGISYILPPLAAVFLGATTIRPGTYNVPGTIIALFFVGVAVSGLAIMGVEPWVTDVLNGGAVIVAVSLSAQFRRRRTGTAELGS
ncbi:ABC transporter permease [Spongiactinospora sp. 9N601]|uniref:ABC transporter permease n=1 Tax=Spongiactinospora sp. 9N601 TaxID=3375149 RepID=UPI0037ABCDF6